MENARDFETLTQEHCARMRVILRNARKRAGMNQSELAARVGIGRNTLVRIEQNPEMASLETFFKIAKELNVPARAVLKEAQRKLHQKADKTPIPI